MTNRPWTLALALSLAGCNGDSGTRTLSGVVDTQQLALTSASVVALSSAGRTYRASVDATGAFSLNLPADATYTVRFANASATAGRYEGVATLVNQLPGGSSRWFTLTSGANINLGRVARAGAALKGAALKGASQRPASGDGHPVDGGAGMGREAEGGVEDDEAKVCTPGGASADVAVVAENDVNRNVDADHDGKDDADDDKDDRAACATAAGDNCHLSDEQEHELEMHAEGRCENDGGDGGASHHDDGGEAAAPDGGAR